MLGKCLTGMLAFFVGPAAVMAATEEPPVDRKKDPIEFRIVVKKDTFTLNLGGRTLQEYRDYLKSYEDRKDARDQRFPAPLDVELTLEWKNLSAEKQTIYVGGDYTLDWELKGPGVITLKPPVAYTDDIKLPKAVTLEPGKTYSITLTKLQGGFRGYGVQVYWTEPGEYTLKASYRTRGEAGDAGSYLSESVKIKVEGPKKNKDPILPGDPPIRILPVDPNPVPPIRVLPVEPALPRPFADPNDKEPVKKEALELTIVAKKDGTTFKIDPKEAKALREELEAILKDAKANRLRERIPAAPTVDFELTIKNVSDKPVDIWVGGDDNLISLELKGPGAVAARYLAITTTEFRLSKKVTLEPGKTYSQPLSSLQHGPRGLGNRWYWTEAGEYTLTATWQLGADEGGKGPKLTSAPLKLTVKGE